VSRESGDESPEFDHLTLRVDLDQPWLTDVGFGELFLEPLRIEDGIVQSDAAGAFRLAKQADHWQLEKSLEDGSWKREYSFSLQAHGMKDFEPRCLYHQTSPESHFTQNRVCTRATPEGRITLSEMNLIVTENGHRREHVLSSEDDRERALQEYFGIRL